MFESAGGHHMNQLDLSGSDGNPAESKRGRRVAMMDLHENQTEYLWREPNNTKQAYNLRPLTHRENICEHRTHQELRGHILAQKNRTGNSHTMEWS